jgi:aryl-alcohol dehydrogenase-like predicted oxidoreductase
VIDLYQLHWPDRSTNHFGELGYRHVADEDSVPILETLTVLDGFVRAGKVRHIGSPTRRRGASRAFCTTPKRPAWRGW